MLFGVIVGSSGLLKSFDNLISPILSMIAQILSCLRRIERDGAPLNRRGRAITRLIGVFSLLLLPCFCSYCSRFSLPESLLLGSVIVRQMPLPVFSILRAVSLGNTDSLLELESGSNDPFSYILTVVCLSLMLEGIKAGEAFLMLFLQVAVGVAVGGAIAILFVFLLRKNIAFKGGGNEVFTIAIALLGYALAEILSGNSYGVYIIGIVLGNQEFPSSVLSWRFRWDQYAAQMHLLWPGCCPMFGNREGVSYGWLLCFS